MTRIPAISIFVSFLVCCYCYDNYDDYIDYIDYIKVRIIYIVISLLFDVGDLSLFLTHKVTFPVQDYGEKDQPARRLSVNGAPQPSPTLQTPVQDPITEAKDPCKDDPCTNVTTTTEARKKKVNAVAPIRTKKCRFCRLY